VKHGSAAAPHATPRVLVVGLGNVLMGDDGFGPYVARLLESRYDSPEGVSILDLGTPGLDLIPFLSDAEVVILLDTVRASGPPGTIRLYDRSALLWHPPQQRIGPHDPGVKEALLALDLAGGGPSEVLLIGVVPAKVRTGTGLSPAVRSAVPRAVRAVLRDLRRRGLSLVRRREPRPPDIWWEAGDDPAGASGDAARPAGGWGVPCTR
jgi:hydrogenase maturation protease